MLQVQIVKLLPGHGAVGFQHPVQPVPLHRKRSLYLTCGCFYFSQFGLIFFLDKCRH